MINPATWVVSLMLFWVATLVAWYFYCESRRLDRRCTQVLHDLREMEQEVEILRRMAAGYSPPQPKPETKPVTKKEIQRAIREMKKWVEDE